MNAQMVPFILVAQNGSSTDNSDMERRLNKLESSLESVQKDISGMQATLARIEERLTHTPTKFDVLKAALVPAIAALAWIVQQFVAPWFTSR